MFGEKYGDRVRVLSMGDVSLEFCGGTHVSTLGEIGPVKIITEGSIASGVRRVEALSGPKAWDYITRNLQLLSQASEKAKTKPAELVTQIDRWVDQLKSRDKQIKELEEKLAIAQASSLLAKAEAVDGVRLITGTVPDVSPDALKALADHLRRSSDDIVAVIATATAADKVSIASGVSDALVKRGLNAGNLVKEAAQQMGGKGGGKPELAQAGGSDPNAIGKAFARVKELVAK